MKDRIKVIARFRPGVPSKIYDIREGSVFVDGKPYTYDNVLLAQCSQDNSTARPIVQELLKGYNATIFVYEMNGRKRGIDPRVVGDIFSHIAKMENNIEFTIMIAYYEIYMEKIRDLLDPNNKNLSIHEDKAKITYVKNVTERYVDTSAQILDLLGEGKRNRSVAVTDMNEHSSRSHSVFKITVNQCNLSTQ
jgi:kinesin family protein 5